MPNTQQATPLTGQHVLFAVIGFFAVIITVNIIFVRLALGSFPGEQEEKSYLQGLNYNTVLEERETERALGWRLLLLEAPRASGEEPKIVLRVMDRAGSPLSGVTVTGTLRRPTTDKGSREITFAPTQEAGRYRANPTAIGAGAWDLDLVAAKEEGAGVNATLRLWVEE